MNFLDIEEKISNYNNSKVVILPTPYEETTSYVGGTKKAPEEIIKASSQVELYDEEFSKEICYDIGIHTAKPIEFEGKKDAQAMQIIKDQTSNFLDDDKFVIALGGEHTISQATIAAHFEKYPEMSVLQFDAHSDLRDEYEGSRFSHACVMARVATFLDYSKITQVGIRAQSAEEAELIRNKPIYTFYANEIKKGYHGDNWQEKVIKNLSQDVYITFDVDYFDPSLMPTTGTPVPDGFFYHETLEIFRRLIHSGRRIIGFDLVELAPIDLLHHTNFTCAQLVYKLINYAFYQRK